MLRDAAGRDHVMLWTGAAAPGFVVTLQPGGAALSFVILRVRDRNLTFRDDSTPTGMIMPDRMEASGFVGMLQVGGRSAELCGHAATRKRSARSHYTAGPGPQPDFPR